MLLQVNNSVINKCRKKSGVIHVTSLWLHITIEMLISNPVDYMIKIVVDNKTDNENQFQWEVKLVSWLNSCSYYKPVKLTQKLVMNGNSWIYGNCLNLLVWYPSKRTWKLSFFLVSFRPGTTKISKFLGSCTFFRNKKNTAHPI